MGLSPVEIGLVVVSNAKVQETAVKAFDAVYLRIFKDHTKDGPQPVIEL